MTSSDTSHGGHSSGDDFGSDSDVDKSRSSKRSSATSKAKASTAAAKKAASAPDSDSSSSDSDSETESESDADSDSTKGTDSDDEGRTAKTKSKASTKSTNQRRTGPKGNPFLRGLTPLSTGNPNVNGNGNGSSSGSASQKSASFTRLSDLRPASLRNLSQPGSPLSTGGSTPLSATGSVQQNGFFESQPLPQQEPSAQDGEDVEDEIETDSDSSSSSSDSDGERPAGRRRVVPAAAVKGKNGKVMPVKRAGVVKDAATNSTGANGTNKKKKDVFSVFG